MYKMSTSTTNGSLITRNGNGNGNVYSAIPANVTSTVTTCSLRSSGRIFTAAGLTSKRQVTLEFQNLSYKVPDRDKKSGIRRRSIPFTSFSSSSSSSSGGPFKSILHGVSGTFKPGELTCILGPSGSGKTTLLNILAGYRTENVDGSILVNGESRQLSSFRKLCCYIMQMDVLLEDLTVQEAMGFAAQLKLDKSVSAADRQEKILDILETIGLEKCLQTKTKALSGGEKKRLAIALELITNPPVMFFDEPTTGLDSCSVVSCVALLKELAANGKRTVIATIHQPSSKIFELFDSMYLLAEGQCLYSGPRSLFVQFLANQQINCPLSYNPADFAIEIASRAYGNEFVTRLKNATKCLQLNNQNGVGVGNHVQRIMGGGEPRLNSRRNGGGAGHRTLRTTKTKPTTSSCGRSCSKFTNEFFVLLRRSFVCVRRDFMLNHLRFGSTLMVGILIGLIFPHAGNNAGQIINNLGGIFFSLLFSTFSGMLVTLLTFPLERDVCKREHMNCWYSIKSYYLARTLADLPFQFFFPTLFTSIIYFMTDQPREMHRFLTVLAVTILISLIGQAIGIFCGALFEIQSAVFIGPLATVPLVLFCGVFGSIKSAPFYIRWISSISFMRFGVQSTIYSLYGYDRGVLPCTDTAMCQFRNPVKFLEQMDMDDVDVPLQIVGLLVTLGVLRVAGFFAMRYKLKNNGENDN